MIISHRHRYIFVHMPKTGGTSLNLALEARVGADDVILSDTPKGKNRRSRVKGIKSRGRLWKHSTLADIEGLVDPAIFDDYLILSIVRNPWSRAVSYYHWAREQKFSHRVVGLARNLEFSEFIRHPLILQQMGVPVRHYLTDGRKQERNALILRLEHLAQDLPQLEQRLGFRLEIPHANRSTQDGRAQFDAEAAALLGARAAEDIARFGYRFMAD